MSGQKAAVRAPRKVPERQSGDKPQPPQHQIVYEGASILEMFGVKPARK